MYSGQLDEEGNVITSEVEKSGRKHSNWLSLMYPRLVLARNLLTNDGIIVVSIDDHEVHNLIQIMNEIYGEENRLGTFIWKRRQNVDSRSKTNISEDHEYLLCYAKTEDSKFRGKEKDLTKYSNPDGDIRGEWMSDNMIGLATKDQRPNLHYDLTDPNTGIVYACPSTGWRYEPKRMQQLIENDEVIFPKNPEGRPRRKKFLKDLNDTYTGFSTILDSVYNTQATREVKELFDGIEVFDFPKPVDLIEKLMEQVVGDDPEAFVIDFFAGSGTTAHALMKLNLKDNGNRKFILIQFKELVKNEQYESIIDITRERIVRAAKSLGIDASFKYFVLDSSNFKNWTYEVDDAQQLAQQLEAWKYPVKEGRSADDVLYEVLLKGGFELTANIQRIQIEDTHFFVVEENKQRVIVYVSQQNISELVFHRMMSFKPTQVWLLDEAFESDDMKKNFELQLKEEGVAFRSI